MIAFQIAHMEKNWYGKRRLWLWVNKRTNSLWTVWASATDLTVSSYAVFDHISVSGIRKKGGLSQLLHTQFNLILAQLQALAVISLVIQRITFSVNLSAVSEKKNYLRIWDLIISQTGLFHLVPTSFVNTLVYQRLPQIIYSWMAFI